MSDTSGGRIGLAKPNEKSKAGEAEKIENESLKREEKRRKARLRKRGPYRKAHSDW
jgi:hypothetical protein